MNRIVTNKIMWEQIQTREELRKFGRNCERFCYFDLNICYFGLNHFGTRPEVSTFRIGGVLELAAEDPGTCGTCPFGVGDVAR